MSILKDQSGDQFEFQYCGFNWKSNLDYACFHHNPATSEGWDVSLNRAEVRSVLFIYIRTVMIPIQHLQCVYSTVDP